MQLPFIDPLLIAAIPHKISLTLVGRDSEMQIIRTLLHTVLQNAPVGARAITIRGEMGVGKSRLLAEVYTEAQVAGFRVIEGRVYEAENLFPYFPFIEALRPVLRTLSTEQLQHYLGLDPHARVSTKPISSYNVENGRGQMIDTTELMPLASEPFIAALAHLFPEISSRLDITIAPENLTPEQEKFRIFDAVATLLERMSQDQPLVFSIENLQWADSVSLELTFYLTMRLRQSRVALLGATRPPNLWDEASQTAENDSIFVKPSTSTPTTAMLAMRALSELMRQGLLLVLPLMPLQPDMAEKYLQQLLPGEHAPELAQTLLSRAEGIPFFLEELVRALTLNQQITWKGNQWQATKTIENVLPTTITIAVKQRLQKLSSPCQELLRIAAHFGRRFSLDALLHVLHKQGIAASELDEAINAHVILQIVQTSDTISNDSIIKPFPTSNMYIFCQGIVQEVLYTEIPTHQVQPLHRAIGKALENTYAHDLSSHVVELAHHAVMGGDRAAALHWSILAGNEATHQQAYREAIGHLRLALTLIEAGETSSTAPTPEHLGLSIGELWFRLGELEQAERTFLHVLDLLQNSIEAEQAQSEEARPLPTHIVSFQIAQANRYLADIYRLQCHYDQALSHLQVAQAFLSQYPQKDQRDREDLASSTTVLVANNSHKTLPDTSTAFASGQAFGQGQLLSLHNDSTHLQRADVHERILLLQAQAILAIFLNRATDSESSLWQSHQLATMIGDRSSQAFALHFVGYLRGWGENIKAAIRLLEQALSMYIAIGDPFHAVLGEQVLGTIYQAQGELEQARSYTQRGFERARRYGVFMHLGWLHWNFSAIALTQGNWSECTEHLQEADASQVARLTPIVLQTRAMLAFRQGDWQLAEQYFRDGVQVLMQTEWYPGSLALYGHFLAVTGNHSTARTLLDKAADHPEPPGYGGDYYIPFLAEGYIHIGDHERSKTYIERIRAQRGFMYYGHAVDRVLGIVAAQSSDWVTSEQAFADGLALCRHAHNGPEEASILYEMARVALMQSRSQPTQIQLQTLAHAQQLCTQARILFLQYDMHRYIIQVETLQTGITQLNQPASMEQVRARSTQSTISTGTIQNLGLQSSEHTLHFHLTRREQEVLCLVAEGHTDREVAERLVISPRTVNRHLSNIFVKLDVPGRAAAVAYAIRQSLV